MQRIGVKSSSIIGVGSSILKKYAKAWFSAMIFIFKKSNEGGRANFGI